MSRVDQSSLVEKGSDFERLSVISQYFMTQAVIAEDRQ